MTRTAKFADSFWDLDYIGTQGFECLSRLMREGRAVGKEVEEYFRQRAKAEANYSKALQNSVRVAEEKNSIRGTLNEAWREVKVQTAIQAKVHEQARADFQQLADDFSKLLEERKQDVKQQEDRLRKSQEKKKSLYNRTLDLEKTYTQKCRDLDQALSQLDQTKNSVTTSQKDLEKARVKADKARENMEQSDSAYKNSLEHLERAREAWETDMRDTCSRFQSIEEDRLQCLQDELWKATNIDSQTCVEHDQSSEAIRCSLELSDPEKDINQFIEHNKTASSPPGQVQYRSHFEEKSRRSSAADKSRDRPPQPTPQGRPGRIHMPHFPQPLELRRPEKR